MGWKPSHFGRFCYDAGVGSATIDPQLYCPGCGYDLRGTPGDTCAECGCKFDRASLSRSSIPWENAAEIGSWRAFWRTAWIFTFRLKKMRNEAAREISYSRARRFWVICVLIAWVALSIPLSAIRATDPSFGLAETPLADLVSNNRFFAAPPSGTLNELALCTVAGFRLRPTPYLSLLLWLAALVPVVTYFFHPRSIPIVRQNRAIALSYYVSAPLAWVPIGVLLAGAGLKFMNSVFATEIVFAVIGFAAFVLGLLVSFPFIQIYIATIRLLFWTTHAGAGRAATAVIAIPLIWALLLPICVLLPSMIAGFIVIFGSPLLN